MSGLSERKTRVMVVEDHQLVRENLSIGLELSGRYEAMPALESGEEVLNWLNNPQTQHNLPDVVLMDICMPHVDGLQATYHLKKAFPQVKVIMLTSMNDGSSVRNSFKAKADGYCTKDTGVKQLYTIIEHVRAGRKWLDPAVAHFILKDQQLPTSQPDLPKPTTSHSSVSVSKPSAGGILLSQAPVQHGPSKEVSEDTLTAREIEILQLIASNHSNEDIASHLGISSNWISGYIGNILDKLCVDNEVAAVERGLAIGVVADAPMLDMDSKAFF